MHVNFMKKKQMARTSISRPCRIEGREPRSPDKSQASSQWLLQQKEVESWWHILCIIHAPEPGFASLAILHLLSTLRDRNRLARRQTGKQRGKKRQRLGETEKETQKEKKEEGEIERKNGERKCGKGIGERGGERSKVDLVGANAGGLKYVLCVRLNH